MQTKSPFKQTQRCSSETKSRGEPAAPPWSTRSSKTSDLAKSSLSSTGVVPPPIYLVRPSAGACSSRNAEPTSKRFRPPRGWLAPPPALPAGPSSPPARRAGPNHRHGVAMLRPADTTVFPSGGMGETCGWETSTRNSAGQRTGTPGVDCFGEAESARAAGSASAAAGGARRRPEVEVDDLVEPAAAPQIVEEAVEGLPQVAPGCHGKSVVVDARQLERHFQVAVQGKETHRRGIVQQGEIRLLLAQGVVIPAREVDIMDAPRVQLLDPLLEAGSRHRRGGLAGEVGGRRDVAVLAHPDDGVHGEVGARAIDFLPPLGSDAERAGDDVALASQQRRHQRREGRLDRAHLEGHA